MNGIRSMIGEVPPNSGGAEEFTGYLEDLSEQLDRLHETQTLAIQLTEALLHSPTDPDMRKLGDLDARLLSFEEPNQLISMVMQASIHQVLSRRRVDDREEAFEISRELYTAMSEATAFIRGLVNVSRNTLQRYFSCR
jgi:hypothetical protein